MDRFLIGAYLNVPWGAIFKWTVVHLTILLFEFFLLLFWCEQQFAGLSDCVFASLA